MKKVVVAISGGLDSSVAAYLLQKKGYDVIGVFMRLGDFSILSEMAARRLCNFLNIRFYTIDFSHQFQKSVIDYFLNSYKNGLTPNPCVYCNNFIKFGILLKFVKNIGSDFLATGHYLEVKKIKNNFHIFRSLDQKKDQSYFLYHLNQEKLKNILFPLGKFKKEKTKQIAIKNNIPFMQKESQDICFLEGDHNVFLKKHLQTKNGQIILRDAKSEENIGMHGGLMFYTLGQRRGINLGGGGPFYVQGFDYEKNILYITKEKDDEVLYNDHIETKKIHWVSSSEKKFPYSCEVSIRYHHEPISCVIEKCEDYYLIKLKESQRAITPGQSMVFYKGREVLGGGLIEPFK